MVMKKFLPSLYDALGVFLPLIVVNCIILERAEAFASCNPVLDSALDGLGMGFGFTLSLTFIGIVRELLGAGSFFGMPIGSLGNVSMTVFILPAGGFLVYGTLMALVNFLTGLAENRKYDSSHKEKKDEKEAKV